MGLCGWGQRMAVLTMAILFTPLLQGQPCPELMPLRSMFMDHSTLEQAEASERMAVRAMQTCPEPCRPVVEAHRWASHARTADFGLNMMDRWNRFNHAVAQLDSLVKAHPELDVLRAHRLSVTGKAPRFLGGDTHWKEDALATIAVSKSDFWAESPKFSEWMVQLATEIQDKTSSE